jgi:hypothetical protein
MLMPYKYGKMGTIPPPRFVEEPIEVPNFTTVEEAENFLADIAQRAGRGELELQSATDVSNLVRNWLLSKHAKTGLDLKIAASSGTGDQIIQIVGGLPRLPGTEAMIMPELNGHELPAPSPAEAPKTELVQQEAFFVPAAGPSAAAASMSPHCRKARGIWCRIVMAHSEATVMDAAKSVFNANK